jgi:hypothetical protein
LRSGQIIYVSYLWVGVDGWHDGVVVVDLHPIMSHGRRRSIPQRSHQNVLILGHVATKVTAAMTWSVLEELFTSQSRSKVTNHIFALTNTKKGNMSMSQYFTKMKGLADELVTSRKILDDEEIVSYILNGLDSDYTPLVSSIMSRLMNSMHKLLALKVGRQCFMRQISSSCP